MISAGGLVVCGAFRTWTGGLVWGFRKDPHVSKDGQLGGF